MEKSVGVRREREMATSEDHVTLEVEIMNMKGKKKKVYCTLRRFVSVIVIRVNSNIRINNMDKFCRTMNLELCNLVWPQEWVKSTKGQDTATITMDDGELLLFSSKCHHNSVGLVFISST